MKTKQSMLFDHTTAMRHFRPLCLAALGAGMAQADLVTSDHFNYTDTPAVQAVWGSGASWTAGLSMGDLESSGDAVQTTGPAAGTQISKTIGTGIANGGAMWTSYLVRQDSPLIGHDFGDIGNVLRNSLAPSDLSYLKFSSTPLFAPAWGGATNSFTDFGAGQGAAGSPQLVMTVGSTYLVISHVDKVGMAAYNGTQYLSTWIFTATGFDSLAAAGVTEANLDTYAASKALAVSATWGTASVNDTDLTVFGNKNGTATFDEYRLGTTLADVTPLNVSPQSDYNSWINSPAYNTPTPLTTQEKLPGSDPDADGINNLLEFPLGGNPVVSSQDILPTEDLDASDIILTFKRSDASEATVTLAVQISEDLDDWTSIQAITIGQASSPGVTIIENGSDDDDVTVRIPRDGSARKLVRLEVLDAE